jgi:hypothetical protein
VLLVPPAGTAAVITLVKIVARPELPLIREMLRRVPEAAGKVRLQVVVPLKSTTGVLTVRVEALDVAKPSVGTALRLLIEILRTLDEPFPVKS